MRTKNNTPVITVPRCRIRSNPLAFCFPNNCSAPPEIAPDKPALFPDWSKTKTIKIIESIISNVMATPSNSFDLLQNERIHNYNVAKNCPFSKKNFVIF